MLHHSDLSSGGVKKTKDVANLRVMFSAIINCINFFDILKYILWIAYIRIEGAGKHLQWSFHCTENEVFH